MQTIIDLMAWLHSAGALSLYMTLTSIIGTAATLAALTPTPKDDNVVSWIKKILDFIGMNILHAKNADQ
jgi:hypothetical protein